MRARRREVTDVVDLVLALALLLPLVAEAEVVLDFGGRGGTNEGFAAGEEESTWRVVEGRCTVREVRVDGGGLLIS